MISKFEAVCWMATVIGIALLAVYCLGIVYVVMQNEDHRPATTVQTLPVRTEPLRGGVDYNPQRAAGL